MTTASRLPTRDEIKTLITNGIRKKAVTLWFSDHAEQRMLERAISKDMVLTAIRRGRIQAIKPGAQGRGVDVILTSNLANGHSFDVAINATPAAIGIITVTPMRKRVTGL